MADPNSPLTPESLQQSSHYNLAMLYYGFFVVATAAAVLALYHCLILRWFADVDRRRLPTWRVPATAQQEGSEPDGRKIVVAELASSTFKYMKKGRESESEECVVCLSVFEEGEDVREMPHCKHYFHALCIDKWLSYHLDCPLCRTPVVGRIEGGSGLPPENSGAGLSESSGVSGYV